MTSRELLIRVEQRLNNTGNPPLPPEETLQAIINLGREKDVVSSEKKALSEEVAELKARVESDMSRMADAELRALQATDKAKEQEWIAHELGKFIRDVANGIYVGQEVPAANRVYDLNKGSLKKQRLNAYNYDSLDEAKEAYKRHCMEEGLAFDEINMLQWLFDYAQRQ